MTKRAVMGLVAAGVVMSGAAAWAATDEANLTVSATVINACTVTTTELAFGDIGAGQGGVATGGEITIDCGANHGNVLDEVTLTSANYSSGWRMRQGVSSDYIAYTLSETGQSAIPFETSISNLFTGDLAEGDTLSLSGAVADAGLVLGDFSDTIVVSIVYSADPV